MSYNERIRRRNRLGWSPNTPISPGSGGSSVLPLSSNPEKVGKSKKSKDEFDAPRTTREGRAKRRNSQKMEMNQRNQPHEDEGSQRSGRGARKHGERKKKKVPKKNLPKKSFPRKPKRTRKKDDDHDYVHESSESDPDEDELRGRRRRRKKRNPKRKPPARKKKRMKKKRKRREVFRVDLVKARKNPQEVLEELEKEGLTRHHLRQECKKIPNIGARPLQQKKLSLLGLIVRNCGMRKRVLEIPKNSDPKTVPPTPDIFKVDPPTPPHPTGNNLQNNPFSTPIDNRVDYNTRRNINDEDISDSSSSTNMSDEEDDRKKLTFDENGECTGLNTSSDQENNNNTRRTGSKNSYDHDDDEDEEVTDDEDDSEFCNILIGNHFRRDFYCFILPRVDNMRKVVKKEKELRRKRKGIFSRRSLMQRIDIKSENVLEEVIESHVIPYCFNAFPHLIYSCFFFYFEEIKDRKTEKRRGGNNQEEDEEDDDLDMSNQNLRQERFRDLAYRYYRYYSRIHQFTRPVNPESIVLNEPKNRGRKGTALYFFREQWSKNYSEVIKSQFCYKSQEQEQQQQNNLLVDEDEGEDEDEEDEAKTVIDDEDDDPLFDEDVDLTQTSEQHQLPKYQADQYLQQSDREERKKIDSLKKNKVVRKIPNFESRELEGLMKLEKKIHDFFPILRKVLIDQNETVCIRGVGSKLAIMYQFILSLRMYFILKNSLTNNNKKKKKRNDNHRTYNNYRLDDEDDDDEEEDIEIEEEEEEDDDDEGESGIECVDDDDTYFIVIHGFDRNPPPDARKFLEKIVNININHIRPLHNQSPTTQSNIMNDDDDDDDEEEENNDDDNINKNLDYKSLCSLLEEVINVYKRGEGKRVVVLIHNVERLSPQFLDVLNTFVAHFRRRRRTKRINSEGERISSFDRVKSTINNNLVSNIKKKRERMERRKEKKKYKSSDDSNNFYSSSSSSSCSYDIDDDDDDVADADDNIDEFDDENSKIHFLFTCADAYANRLISRFVDRYYYLDTFRTSYIEEQNRICPLVGGEEESNQRIKDFIQSYWNFCASYQNKTIWAAIVETIFTEKRKTRSLFLYRMRMLYGNDIIDDRLVEHCCNETKYLKFLVNEFDTSKKKVQIQILTIPDLLKLREHPEIKEFVVKEIWPKRKVHLESQMEDEVGDDVNDGTGGVDFQFSKPRRRRKRGSRKQKQKQRKEMVDEDVDDEGGQFIGSEGRGREGQQQQQQEEEQEHEEGQQQRRMYPQINVDDLDDDDDDEDDEEDENHELSIFLRTLCIFRAEDD